MENNRESKVEKPKVSKITLAFERLKKEKSNDQIEEQDSSSMSTESMSDNPENEGGKAYTSSLKKSGEEALLKRITVEDIFTKHKEFVLRLIEKDKFDLVQSYFNSVFLVAKDIIPPDNNSFKFFMNDADYIKRLLDKDNKDNKDNKKDDMLIFENDRQNLINRVSEFFSLGEMVSYVGADWIENKSERLSNFDSCGILNRALLNFAKGWSKELDPEIQKIVSSLFSLQNCWKPTTKTLKEKKISNLRDNANHNQNRGKSNKFWIGSSIIFSVGAVALAVCAFLFNPLIFGIASGILGIFAGVSIYNASNKSNDSKQPGQVR